MNLQNNQQSGGTKEKLRRLETRYQALRDDERMDRHVRELSMVSLRQMINQFKEEIARYEASHLTVDRPR